MRNLCIQCMKSLLTDHFCYDLTLWLVCYSIFIIEHRTIRQIFQNTSDNILRILSAQCRTRNDLREITHFTVGIDCRKDFLFGNRINLIDDQDYRNSDILKLFCDVTLSCPGASEDSEEV